GRFSFSAPAVHARRGSPSRAEMSSQSDSASESPPTAPLRRSAASEPPATLSPPRVVGRYLAEEIDLCQIDDLVAAPAENRFEHEEAQAGHLLEGDRRRHGELLAVDEDLDKSGSVVLEGSGDHRSNVIRRFGRQPQDTGGLGHLGEIR